jgi:hypothetical protein
VPFVYLALQTADLRLCDYSPVWSIETSNKKQTDRQTDSQTDRQTDRHKHENKDRRTKIGEAHAVTVSVMVSGVKSQKIRKSVK